MTFVQAYEKVLKFAGEDPSNPNALNLFLAKDLLNHHLKRIFEMRPNGRTPWSFLLDTFGKSLTLVASQSEYVLTGVPWNGWHALRSGDDPPVPYHVINAREAADLPIDTSGIDNGLFYVLSMGFSPITYTLTGGETISIVSDDATDTAQSVGVTGTISAGGSEVTKTAELNGTTSVDFSDTFYSTSRIYITAETRGQVSVTSSGSTISETFSPGQLEQAKYAKIKVFPTPTSAGTIYYDSYKSWDRIESSLENNWDAVRLSNFPDELQQAAVYGAAGELLMTLGLKNGQLLIARESSIVQEFVRHDTTPLGRDQQILHGKRRTHHYWTDTG